MSSDDIAVLMPDASKRDLEVGRRYLGRVNNIAEYGVFVDLTPDLSEGGSDLSGLVHERNLPATASPRDFTVGERCVVELDEFRENGDIALEMHYSESAGAKSGPIPEDDHFSNSAVATPGVTLEDVMDEVRALAGAVEGLSPADLDDDDLGAQAVEVVTSLHADEGYEATYLTKDLSGGGAKVVVEFEERGG